MSKHFFNRILQALITNADVRDVRSKLYEGPRLFKTFLGNIPMENVWRRVLHQRHFYGTNKFQKQELCIRGAIISPAFPVILWLESINIYAQYVAPQTEEKLQPIACIDHRRFKIENDKETGASSILYCAFFHVEKKRRKKIARWVARALPIDTILVLTS